MITEEEILLSIPNLYNLNWWPKDDFENIQGFNMKSSEEEFADAVKEVTDYLGKQTKGNIFKIGRSKFKIKQTDLRRKEINIVIDESIFEAFCLQNDLQNEVKIHQKCLPKLILFSTPLFDRFCPLKACPKPSKSMMFQSVFNYFTKNTFFSFGLCFQIRRFNPQFDSVWYVGNSLSYNMSGNFWGL